MKKVLFVSILAGLALVGCTNDELVDNNGLIGGNSETIGFTYNKKNMTRADAAQTANHYEFGVFAYGAAKTYTIMDNYLVGYGNVSADANSTPKLYSALNGGASTWGNATPDDAVTDPQQGYSSWFYEGLSTSANTGYNTPLLTQVLKFWDKSQATTEFWAYAPYSSADTDNPDAVAFDYDNNKFTFTNVSAFYTDPLCKCTAPAAFSRAKDYCYQPEKFNEGAAVNFTALDVDVAKYNAEIINYNEAIYAYNKVEKSNYGNDVPLDFKHANAKIMLKFYETVPGYKVQITDLHPTKKAANVAGFEGIQLTPATAEQAAEPIPAIRDNADPTEAAKAVWNSTNGTGAYGFYYSAKPKYNQYGTVEVTGLSTTPVVATTSEAAQDENLYFNVPTSGTAIAESNTGTASSTTYYALPVKDAASNVVGWTLHVSYELVPEDGTSHIQVYDARVFIPADKCAWEADKAYTYLFRITSASTGTTNPDDPTIDGNDPRVPADQALLPIVFDGVTVSDYTTEVPVSPEFIISSYAWNNGTKDYYISSSTLTAADLASAGITPVDPTGVFTTTLGDWSYDYEHNVFQFKDKSATPKLVATFLPTTAKPEIPQVYDAGDPLADPAVPETPASTVSTFIWAPGATTAYELKATCTDATVGATVWSVELIATPVNPFNYKAYAVWQE